MTKLLCTIGVAALCRKKQQQEDERNECAKKIQCVVQGNKLLGKQQDKDNNAMSNVDDSRLRFVAGY